MELDRTMERLGMPAVNTDAEGSQQPSAKAKRSQMPLGNAELDMVAHALTLRREGRASTKRKVEKLQLQRDAVGDMEVDRAKKPLDRFVIPSTPIQMNHVLVLDGRNCGSLRAFLAEVAHRLELREGACQKLDDFRNVLDGRLGGLKQPFTVAVTHAVGVPQPPAAWRTLAGDALNARRAAVHTHRDGAAASRARGAQDRSAQKGGTAGWRRHGPDR